MTENLQQDAQLCSSCSGIFELKKSHGIFGPRTITHKANRRALFGNNGCAMCIELLPLVQLSDRARTTELKALLLGVSDTQRNEFEVSFKYFESKWIKSGLRVSLPGLENGYHIRLSVDDDSGVAQMIKGRKPYSNVSSSKSLALLKECIHICDTTHDKCPKLAQSRLPKRLIDVRGDTNVRIFCPDKRARGSYIALSYCWGAVDSNKQVKTTKGNLEEHICGIVMATLPKTIRDVIIFARKMELCYVWVDALCILQDDTEDKYEQMALMGDLYANAYLTVSATSAEGCDEGFLQPRYPTEYSHFPIRYTSRHGETSEVNLSKIHKTRALSKLNEPTNQRGWIFQETYLSSRTIFFGSIQPYFHCQTNSCSGGDPAPREYFHRTGLNKLLEGVEHHPITLSMRVGLVRKDRSVLQNWHLVVEDYSQRQFGNPSDKMPAISSVAARWQPPNINDRYLAGLWHSTLATDLLWQATKIDRKSNQCANLTPNTYVTKAILPSWSWMSVIDPVQYDLPHFGTKKLEREFRLLHANMKLESAARPFGTLLDATITIASNVITVFVPSGETSRLCVECFDPDDGDQYGNTGWGLPKHGASFERRYGHHRHPFAARALDLGVYDRVREKMFGTSSSSAAGSIRFDREVEWGESARENTVNIEPSRFLCLLIAVNCEAVMTPSEETPSLSGIPKISGQIVGTRALGLIIEPEYGWDKVIGRPRSRSRSWEPYTGQEIRSLRSLRCRRIGLFVGSPASSNRFRGLQSVELTLA